MATWMVFLTVPQMSGHSPFPITWLNSHRSLGRRPGDTLYVHCWEWQSSFTGGPNLSFSRWNPGVKLPEGQELKLLIEATCSQPPDHSPLSSLYRLSSKLLVMHLFYCQRYHILLSISITACGWGPQSASSSLPLIMIVLYTSLWIHKCYHLAFIVSICLSSIVLSLLQWHFCHQPWSTEAGHYWVSKWCRCPSDPHISDDFDA